eukprot:CAMPEP_0202895432 /NCGR_PEP_ID=MMETSP1392-20130828/4639_1 /ASSEMBLY_ACC=CAM_ASM_000868 /TAXON_ID=225041 /ORGANISM="Chlamydomonas chlamydogama, Strain SAG 11-48b" /LENGTH=262 /DNA_ID=CAMNT_0049580443 /DNA_START=40 /DNA_END=825 /DNA_ORIENTATION=-
MPRPYKAIRPMFKTGRWRIFPGDEVMVRRGPDQGCTGKVLQVIQDTRVPQVIVEGVNQRKKKVYTGQDTDDFFVVTMEAPIHYSSVGLIDPSQGINKPVRTGFRYLQDGTRVRVAKGSKFQDKVVMFQIPKQDEENAKIGLCGPKDTPEEEVLRGTYDPTARFPFSSLTSTSSRYQVEPSTSQRSSTSSTTSPTVGSTSTSTGSGIGATPPGVAQYSTVSYGSHAAHRSCLALCARLHGFAVQGLLLGQRLDVGLLPMAWRW